MKLRIVRGDALMLEHEHFKAGSAGLKSMTIETLPEEGLLLHKGKAVEEPGMMVSGMEILDGDLVYMPSPNQNRSATLNYTVQSRAGTERRDYIVFDADMSLQGKVVS